MGLLYHTKSKISILNNTKLDQKKDVICAFLKSFGGEGLKLQGFYGIIIKYYKMEYDL